VDEVLAAIRQGGDGGDGGDGGGDLAYDRIPAPDGIDDVVDAVTAAITAALSGQTLKELALSSGDMASRATEGT
jgi:hypothetical protein